MLEVLGQERHMAFVTRGGGMGFGVDPNVASATADTMTTPIKCHTSEHLLVVLICRYFESPSRGSKW